MELSKTKLGQYAGLQRGKMREKEGLFVAEGRKSVLDLLPYFRAEAVICLRGCDVAGELPQGVTLYETGEKEMRKLSSLTTPPDVLAVFRIPQEIAEEDLKVEDGLYLLLDGVRDPGNMGTIIRTAHWFGIDAIFASRDCVDIYNPKTIQATMGSLGRVKVRYCDLAALIKENGDMPVYGTLLDGENIYEANLGQRGFILMGNEGKGISAELRELITDGLLIPPYDATDHSESLNVAVATGVVLSLFRENAR